MKIDLTGLIQGLNADEADVLLQLYYTKGGDVDGFTEPDLKEEVLHSLIDKNLVCTNVSSGENIVMLTDEGFNVCGSIMVNRIAENTSMFKQRIQVLPERAVTCLVNRVMWSGVAGGEDGFVDMVTKPYALDEDLWYEQVLLKDERMNKLLEEFYSVLEGLGFIRNVEGERLCSPEAEEFLRGEYKDMMSLSWAEEDSLKYYYFFYIYAQDQKNLIVFSGDGEEYRSLFFDEGASPPDYWFSTNRLDPRMLLSNLGVSENRITGFLEEMQRNDIVGERYYPLSSFSFFSEDDKIFVIRDIKAFMDFITNEFLSPVVDSLLKTN